MKVFSNIQSVVVNKSLRHIQNNMSLRVQRTAYSIVGFLVFHIFLLVLRLQIRIFNQKIDDWKSVNHYFRGEKTYSDNIKLGLQECQIQPSPRDKQLVPSTFQLSSIVLNVVRSPSEVKSFSKNWTNLSFLKLSLSLSSVFFSIKLYSVAKIK